MKRFLVIALLAFPLLVLAADTPPDKGEPPKRGGEEWNEQLETVLIARLTRILEMKPDQAKLFFPLLNDFQDKNKTLRHDHMDLMQKLRKLGDPGSSATAVEVDGTIKELAENQKSQMLAVAGFVADAGKVLQPWQVARLQIFIIRFPERVEQIMRDRMGNNGGGGGPRFRGGRGGYPDGDDDK